MTCIAYKDGVVAYDSRITEGDLIVSDNYDKKYEADGLVIFSAGELGQDRAFAEAYILRDPNGIRNAQGLVIDGDKLFICTISNKSVQVYEWDKSEPRAIGTGEPYALTAMRTYGASPQEAVKAAMSYDNNTGGKIRTFKL